MLRDSRFSSINISSDKHSTQSRQRKKPDRAPSLQPAGALALCLPMQPRYLLVTPCDPGNCHIYFGVQLRALPTALALAKSLKRTLVLPPFEWYENQAQVFANAFRATADGRLPHFVPWSDLFDIERFRLGADVVDWYDAAGASLKQLDRAVLHVQGGTGGKAVADDDVDPLGSVLSNETPCKPSKDGLRANLSWVSEADSETPSRAIGIADLYGRALSFAMGGRRDVLRCGSLSLNLPGSLSAVGAWTGEGNTDPSSLAAIFNVGHHVSARVHDGGRTRAILQAHLRPNAMLEMEATRLVTEWGLDTRPVVAVHWRHGDYVAYRLLTSLETLVDRVRRALDVLKCVRDDEPRSQPQASSTDGAQRSDCRVFLMTNCRNSSAIDAFIAAMAPSADVVRFAPSEPRFQSEGPRLVIEQSIASRAKTFVPSPRSAVSEYVEMLRWGRRADSKRAAAAGGAADPRGAVHASARGAGRGEVRGSSSARSKEELRV
jgi:hypothetical protein